MSIYPNLPGIEVSIADGGLILPEDASTQSMLIIAPSLKADAPKQPVLIRQSNDLVANGFGNFTENGQVNEIAIAWKAAFEGGCRNIYLMALEGADDVAKFTFLQDAMFGILADFTISHVVVLGVSADKDVTLPSMPALTEGVSQMYSVEGSALTFPQTVAAGTSDTIKVGTTVITLAAKSYATSAELLTEIQKEINEANLQMKAQFVGNKLRLSQTSSFTLATGTNAAGLTTNPAPAQSIKGNFALLAGHYAESQTLNLSATVAYVGTSAPVGNSLAQVKTHVDTLTAIANEYSGYVSVISAPELGYIVPGRSELHYMNGAVTYAALVSTLRPESAPTSKRVYGVAGIRYNLSLRQLNNLTGNKFVTFRLKNNQIVVTDGCTTAPDYYLGGVKQSSDYARLSTLRITQAAAQLIRELTEPYIGEPNRMPQYNALNATIKAGLEAMKNQGAIMDYRFTVVATGGTLSGANVTLEIIPAFELKKITVNVSLKPPFTF